MCEDITATADPCLDRRTPNRHPRTTQRLHQVHHLAPNCPIRLPQTRHIHPNRQAHGIDGDCFEGPPQGHVPRHPVLHHGHDRTVVAAEEQRHVNEANERPRATLVASMEQGVAPLFGEPPSEGRWGGRDCVHAQWQRENRSHVCVGFYDSACSAMACAS